MDVNLKYTLTKIIEKSKNIPYINQGGCCYFATILAKELVKRNIKFKVVLYDEYPQYLFNIVKNIRKNTEYISGVRHVVIKIDNFFMDATVLSKHSCLRSKGYNKEACTLNHRTFKLNSIDLTHYSKSGNWNEWYDKNKWNTFLESVIKSNFKIYDQLINQDIDE